jgi:hypothetical protein
LVEGKGDRADFYDFMFAMVEACGFRINDQAPQREVGSDKSCDRSRNQPFENFVVSGLGQVLNHLGFRHGEGRQPPN